MDVRAKRPVERDDQDEVDAIRKMTLNDIKATGPTSSHIEHAEAIQLREKADSAARRNTGLDKISHVYDKQTSITFNARPRPLPA